MTTTYLLHVAGKTIGRESGLRPIPVQVPAGTDHTAPLEEVMLATVRRCLPLAAGELRVLWPDKRTAVVHVLTPGAAPYRAARFTIRTATAADHQVGGTQLPKGYAR